jgi:uncharacterized RDD family membrane protein YckC
MSELTINTTQNVAIKFKAASIGDRMLASFLDILIKIAYFIVVYYFLIELTGLNENYKQLDQWSVMAIMIIVLFPIFVYSLLLESMFEGQTFGKRILKIKVVKIDGYQASFGDYLIRWLFRIVENNIMFGLIGLIAMIVSKNIQRLGDMAAGTAVITLKNTVNISHTILEEIHTEYQPKYPLVIKLSDNDMRIIKETYNRALSQDDVDVLIKLVDKIENVTGIRKQGENNTQFIKTVLKDYSYYTQNM